MKPTQNKTGSISNLAALAKVIEGAAQDETVRLEDKPSPLSFVPETSQNENTTNAGTPSTKVDIEAPVNWNNCDFETAMSATGYGKYNLYILVISVFPMLSCVFATSTISYILPSAECDLGLSNMHKGLLNASTYTGMICSAFFWGFLADNWGRQKLLVITFALDGLLNLLAGLAQNFEILFTAKLLAGFICSGPYAILMTYLAECHSAEHRASIIQWCGAFSAVGTVGLPLLAWAIIPEPWYTKVLIFELPSWRIFLIVCTIPAFISAISFYFQSESPKFLMSAGKNEEAMKAFQTMYSMNKGKPKYEYPVRSLIIEKATEKEIEAEDGNSKSIKRFLKHGWMQVLPLFKAPHLRHALLIFVFQAGTLYGLNTLRLWMPQLFSSILENEHLSANATSVCDLLVEPPKFAIVNNTETVNCTQHLVQGQVYINSVVIGAAVALGYLTAGYLVKGLGKKWLIIGCTFITVGCSIWMYWSTTSNLMLALSSVHITLLSVSSTAIISVVVDLFPTTLRTMAVSLTMMFGRLGAMTGNLIFPMLLDYDCTVPFFLIAGVLCCTGVIIFFLPKTKGKALE